MRTRTILPALLAALAACTPPPAVLHPVSAYGPAQCDGRCGDVVEVTYLGVGGFLIRHGRDAVLTAPFFSTPRLSAVLTFRPIHPDSERIAAGMRRLGDLTGVHALLVGHGHYDHLMDVPDVVRRYLPGVTVYGNRSMVNTLAPDSAWLKMVALDDPPKLGTWIYPEGSRAVRFMALPSEHAPHLLGFRGLRRKEDRPRRTLPPTAWTWAEGQTLAYVIEFLDPAQRPIFRVHFQDAGSTPPLGFPPAGGEPDRRLDLAILCAGNYDQVFDYPDGFLHATRPRHVVVGHWENFFRPQSASVRLVPFLSAVRLVRRIDAALPEDADRTTPKPGAVLRFCVCGAPGGAAGS